MRTRAAIPAQFGFLVSVGVPNRNKDAHCKRVLTVLRQAGYQCGPTSGDTILELAEQERLTRELAANDNPEGGDD